MKHDQVDESRGGADGVAALSAEARRLGMGVLVDIVPNHIGVDQPVQNPWWQSLLDEGQASPYADHFDVDWEYGHGRLVVPSAENHGDLNYRRFFTISTLAGVRVEEPAVFEATHVEIRAGSTRGSSTGCGSTTPTGSATPRATSATSRS